MSPAAGYRASSACATFFSVGVSDEKERRSSSIIETGEEALTPARYDTAADEKVTRERTSAVSSASNVAWPAATSTSIIVSSSNVCHPSVATPVEATRKLPSRTV